MGKTLKRHINILERIFTAEINQQLPYQSKSKIMSELVDLGYVEFAKYNIGQDRFGSFIVEGYTLTHLGRMIYCENCKDIDVVE